MTNFSLTPLTSSATAVGLPRPQHAIYSQNHLTNTVLSLIFQMALLSSQEGGLNYLNLTDCAYFYSTCKIMHINSRLIWKNLLIHHNNGVDHGFIKKHALNTIHPSTYKVIFLQLTKLQISFETPHLVFKAGERGCKEMMDLLVANENKIYIKVADVLVRRRPMPNPSKHQAFVGTLKKDINMFKKRDKDGGWTPLIHATLAGDTDLVRTLLAHHASCRESDKKSDTTFNIDSRNNEGYTPLMYAAAHGYQEIARMLLESGAQVDETDNFQSTPLLEATVAGHIKVVGLLLKHRADIEKADPFGKTPLMHAAEEGQLEILNLLIENKADLMAKDLGRRTVGFFASFQQSQLATRDSQTHESDPNKMDIHNAAMRQAKIVETLLQALADLKEREENASSNKRRKH